MVYKKYIKKKGKLYGPYYYKNVRDKSGKVKNIFIGKAYKKKVAPQKIINKFRLFPFLRDFNFYLIILIICLGVIVSFMSYEKIIGAPLGAPPNFNGEVPTDSDLYEDQLYECDVNATDPEGGVLTFSDNTNLFNINPNTGMISFTPTINEVGSYTGDNAVAIIVQDDEVPEQGATYFWGFTIHEVNDAPQFVDLETDYSVTAYHLFSYDVNATDEEDSPDLPENQYNNLIFSSEDLWSGINPSTGEVSFIPTNSDEGLHTITVTVTDTGGRSAQQNINLMVIKNNAPYFLHVLNEQYAKTDKEFVYDILASDPDNDIISFIIDDTDLGIFDIETIDNLNGTFSGRIRFTPTVAQIGLHWFRVNISDTIGLNDSIDFNININENLWPNIEYIEPIIYEVEEYENETFSFNQSSKDLDDPVLYYYWYQDGEQINNTENLSFFTDFYISNNSFNNTLNISFIVKDETGGFNSNEWNLSVFNVNQEPYLAREIPNITWYKNSIGTLDSLDNYFSDPDNDILNYSAEHLDTNYVNVIVNEETHVVTFNPQPNWFGNETILFIADDTELNATSNNITLEVLEQEVPPITVPTPSSGGGGGGGGGSSSRKKIAALTIVVAPLIVMPPYDTITTNIVLINTGEVTLDNVLLSTNSEDEDLILSLAQNKFSRLDVGQRVNSDLTITSFNLTNKPYEILVVANVTQPVLSETDIIYLTPLPLNVTKIEKEIIFAKDFFEENAECLEFKELITLAEEKNAQGQEEEAIKLIETAVNSCKEILRTSRVIVEKPYAMQSYYLPVTISLAVLLLVTIAIIIKLFRKKNK